jgi:acetyl esterase/lipase
MDLRAEPRVNPRLLAALAAFGLDAAAAPAPFGRDVSAGVLDDFITKSEAAFEGLYEALPNALPGDDFHVTHTTESIRGVDGNAIALHLYRPEAVKGTLPCTIYIHGGGMTILKADNKVHRQWAIDLAQTGMLVVAVDFRNANGAAGRNPFPAGLDDCSSALAWVHAHKKDLGISRVVLQGESGGANLALATTLKAKREEHLHAIDGVYAMVPYISGAYGWDADRKLRELPSLVECDSYFLNGSMMDLLAHAYDPSGDHAHDPLAWPYFATVADVTGLPPHVISADELDPLRDEGIAYFRALQRAGVPSTGRVNLGLTHGAETIYRQAVSEAYGATIRDIKRFAEGG